MRSFSIDGVIPIIPTPFKPDEQVDWEALGRLVDFACVSGAAALCLPAYASEFYKLNDEERQRAISRSRRSGFRTHSVIGQVNAPSAGRPPRPSTRLPLSAPTPSASPSRLCHRRSGHRKCTWMRCFRPSRCPPWCRISIPADQPSPRR